MPGHVISHKTCHAFLVYYTTNSGLVGVNRCLNRTKPHPYTTVCHHWQYPPCPPLSKAERKPPGDLSEQIMCTNLMWCDLVRIQPSQLRSARARGPPGWIYGVSRNAMISRCGIREADLRQRLYEGYRSTLCVTEGQKSGSVSCAAISSPSRTLPRRGGGISVWQCY